MHNPIFHEEPIASAIADLPEDTPAEALFLDGDATLTHGTIRQQIAKTRALFTDLRLAPCDRVVIASADDATVSTLYGATLTAGLTAIVIDPRASAAELTVLINHAEPTVVFADAEVADRSMAVSRDTNAQLVRIAPPTSRRTSFGLLLRGRRRGSDEVSYPNMLSRFEPESPIHTQDPDATALILFTSGTTSQPKGVELTFRNLSAQMKTFRQHYAIGAGSVVVNHLPLHHTDGLHQGPLIALAAGATVVRPGPITMQTLGSMLDTVYRKTASHLITVPTVLEMMMRLPEEYDDSFSSPKFRFIGSTAGFLAQHTWQAIEERFGVMVVNSYGLTETTSEALYCGPTEETRRLGTVGKPIDCEAMLADADGNPVPADEAGELCIRGENVMRGYFRAPEATAASFRDGWLRTGDLARRDEDGFFQIVGRLKSVIVRGGTTVYPEDVAEALLSSDDVAAASVIGVQDDLLGEQIVACVVARGEPTDDLKGSLLDHCRQKLAPEKVPDRIVALDALPYGPSGKVDIGSLRTIVGQMDAGEEEDASSLSEMVLSIAANAFGRARGELSPSTALDDDSVVDSLRYLEFVMALERRFKIRLSPRETMSMRRLEDAISVVEAHSDTFAVASGATT